MSDSIPERDRDNHWRALIIPAEIMKELQGKELSPREVLLLALIESLVKCKGVGKFEGCYASNSYLGEQVGIDPRNVRGLISRLIDKGFLIRAGHKKIGDQNLRLLETCWSRITRKPLKKGERKQRRINSSGGEDKLVRGGRTNSSGGRGDKFIPQLNTIDSDKIAKEDKYLALPDGKRDVGENSSFGIEDANTEDAKQMAHRLLVKVKKEDKLAINAKPSLWYRHFKEMMDSGLSKERIGKTLSWYLENFTGERAYQAYSGSAFKTKFKDIEETMQRQSGGKTSASPQSNSDAAFVMQDPQFGTIVHPHKKFGRHENYMPPEPGMMWVDRKKNVKLPNGSGRLEWYKDQEPISRYQTYGDDWMHDFEMNDHTKDNTTGKRIAAHLFKNAPNSFPNAIRVS